MGRIRGRSSEETRSLALEAASQLFLERGLAATLDQVAQRAGVSKGGLIYHFASKNELIEALAERQIALLREQYQAHLDPDDKGPGRLTRAYIRAVTSLDADALSAQTRWALLTLLSTLPRVQELMKEDSLRWSEELAGDGLEATLADVVITAADGLSAAPVWSGITSTERVTALRERLLELTHTSEATVLHPEDGR